MKKLSAILVAFLLAAGLAAATAPANAATYPGTVKTYCHVNFKHRSVRYHHADPVRFWVNTSGTGRPTGRVKITATSRQRTYSKTYAYQGGKHYHPFRVMKRGRYTIHMKFTARAGSVYKGCGARGPAVRIR